MPPKASKKPAAKKAPIKTARQAEEFKYTVEAISMEDGQAIYEEITCDSIEITVAGHTFSIFPNIARGGFGIREKEGHEVLISAYSSNMIGVRAARPGGQ